MKSFKYRLYPTPKQEILLRKTFGCVRFLWNRNVEEWNKPKEERNYRTSTELRAEFDFLKEVSSVAIQQKENDFKEFKNQKFSKNRKSKVGNPQFKSKKNKQSFRLTNQTIQLFDDKIFLSKIGKVRLVQDRPFTGKIMSATVSMDRCGDFWVAIQTETEATQLPKTGRTVGIDLGLKQLVTTSDGLQFSRLRDDQTKTKHIQRCLYRKTKGSIRFKKLRLRLAKLHRTTARRREWLLHNISKWLVVSYDTIVTESLNTKGMLKNHRLAGAISDASWDELIRQLKYKTEGYGKELIQIDRWFPSTKLCSCCGQLKTKEELTLSTRTYVCDCGLVIDRDLNAALNIKAEGVASVRQTATESQTRTDEQSLIRAFPVDLFSFL